MEYTEEYFCPNCNEMSDQSIDFDADRDKYIKSMIGLENYISEKLNISTKLSEKRNKTNGG